jgi:oligoendopeptidase F
MSTATQITGAEDVAWDLSDLYAGPDDAKLEHDLEEAERASAAFRDRYYGRLAELSAAELADAVAERERIDSIVDRVMTFAQLRFSTNMADSERGALVQRIHERAAVMSTQLLFFGLDWAELADELAEPLLADPALAPYRHYLASFRLYRPYLLSEPEERIMTEKAVPGSSAWSRLFSELLSALRVEVDGEELPMEIAFAKLQDADRDVRATMAEAITAGLQPGLRTRTFIFNSILLDKSIDDRLRGYPSWISARNLSNEVTDEAVQALVDATTSRFDVPQRYYRLKARLLGLDRLEHWDRVAPLAEETSFTSWDDARRIVVDAYNSFSDEAGSIVNGFFKRSWIDGPVRPDKATGAFCATTVPGVHPYVLMNYTGDRRSILTLAHELGHGLHGVLAQPLGLYNASTPLTLAETASVFGEALTFRSLVEAEPDPQRKLHLVANRVEDAIATIWRQIAMNRFEHAVHTARRNEGELSSERIAEAWLTTQRELFGDSVSTESYDTWWSYIPHFMSAPGYVYAYAYGYLFSLAIYRRYELEGGSVVEPYFELLRKGGSDSPERLAEIVGLDLSSPAIWASGIEALDELLAEAETLIDD